MGFSEWMRVPDATLVVAKAPRPLVPASLITKSIVDGFTNVVSMEVGRKE